MNISLRKLVNRSTFSKYYFITDADKFEFNSKIDVELKDCTFSFEFSQVEGTDYKYYDLGKCMILLGKNAYVVAKYIEKSKLFEFDYLEPYFDVVKQTCIAYIHLKRKNK